MKYQLYARVIEQRFLGEVEADNRDEALEQGEVLVAKLRLKDVIVTDVYIEDKGSANMDNPSPTESVSIPDHGELTS